MTSNVAIHSKQDLLRAVDEMLNSTRTPETTVNIDALSRDPELLEYYSKIVAQARANGVRIFYVEDEADRGTLWKNLRIAGPTGDVGWVLRSLVERDRSGF